MTTERVNKKMASKSIQLTDAAVTVVVVGKTAKALAVYDDMIKKTFKPRSGSGKILTNFSSLPTQSLSASSSLLTYKCDFNIDLLSMSDRYKSDNFSKFFFDACVNFCIISREKNLKLWLSTDLPQAYARVIDDAYVPFYPGIKVKSLSLGAMEDRCTFIDHCCLTQPSEELATVDFEHDTKLMTVKFQMGDTNAVFEMELRYDTLDDLIIIDKPSKSSCCAYFMLSTPPCLYKITQNNKFQNYRFRVTGTNILTTYTLGDSSVLALSIAAKHHESFLDVVCRLQALSKKIQWAHVNVKQPERIDESMKPTFQDCFKMQYSLESLLWYGFVVTDRVKGLYDKLSRLTSSNYREAERALNQLALQVEKDRFTDLAEQFQINLEKFLQQKSEDDFHDSHFLRRAIFTPTRCILLQPELAYGNRILRQYGEEYCLRVVFRDENFDRLNTDAAQAKVISTHIQKILTRGLRIGQRRYHFLACSNSQLRDHGCWLYAEDQNGQTAADIRDWMGDFSGITNVAKYIARMGQCFSKSEESVNVSKDDVKVVIEDDVNSEDGRYCFSDGIGKVSTSLAAEMAKGQETKTPSAFQIRFQGCKGVVALDPTLEGNKLVIRRSMEKFQSTHKGIEVVKNSQPCSLYLNRQAITLLSGLGVEDQVFQSLQEDMLLKLGRMLLDEEQAAKSLTFHKSQSINIDYNQVLDAGISLTTEPFLRGLLGEVYTSSTYELQRRARIEIPPAFGRNMIGVLDETGRLNYGEVFVQYSKNIHNPQEETVIHSGMVVVSKFPALHPGDMRKFNAVDIPELRHMVDCIVFPRRGERPHPDEMAGSDLDGDEYFVTWLPELIFKGDNEEPMDFDFKIPQKPDHTGPIETSHMSQYMAEYIMNDKLGRIANAHLAQADKCGIFSKVCKEIAEIHAQSVDFAKTGYSPNLCERHRPYLYADFMEKTDTKCSYKSCRVLGCLFRQCRTIDRMVTQNKGFQYNSISPDPFLIHPEWEKFEESAQNTLDQYNRRLEEILLQYGVENESEALSGCIRKLNPKLTQVNEIYDAKMLIDLRLKDLRRGFRRNYFHEFGKEDTIDSYTDEMLAKASAWYMVTYSQKTATYLSFPWVVSDVVFEVRRRCQRLQEALVPSTNVMQRLSSEADLYRENANEDRIRDIITTEYQGTILKHLQENPLIQSVTGLLLVWHGKQRLTVSKSKLLLLLLDFVANENTIKPVDQKSSSAFNSIKPNNSKEVPEKAATNVGELLVKFFSYCASCRFRRNLCPIKPQTIEVAMSQEERSQLSAAAEIAYHGVSIHGTLQSVIKDQHDLLQTKDHEIIIRVNQATYGDRHRLFKILKEKYPEVSTYFRPIKGNAKKSDAYVTIRGPERETNKVHDFLLEFRST